MESLACENRIAPGQNLFDFIVQKRLRYGIIPLQADWKEVSHAPLCVPLPRHPGKIIGALGFNEIVRGAFQSCFVSYKIDAALWGRGYGSEAIRYGTGWAFRVLGLHRAEANVMPRNAASLRAAEKAGYRPEGLARRYLNINGVWEDHIHMVKLNEEEFHA